MSRPARRRSARTRDAAGQTLLEWGDPYCTRCGRRLRSALSRRRGVGPGCFRKVNERDESQRKDAEAQSRGE